MKKLGFGVILVVAVLLLGSPPLIGARTEGLVNERIAAINEGGFWTVDLKSFDRGWFKSHASLDVGANPAYLGDVGVLGAAAGFPSTPRIGVVLDFAHGPVAVQNGVYFGLSKLVARPDPTAPGTPELQAQLGVPYLFEFRGRSSFFGTMTFDGDIPGFDAPNAMPVQFSGAFFDGTFDGTRLTSNATIDSFQIDSPFFAFGLRNLKFTSDNELLSWYTAPGTAQFSVEKVSVTNPQLGPTPLFDADNFRVGTNVTLDDEMINMEATYDLDSLLVNDMRFAAASLGMTFRNIDVALLQTYVDMAQGAAAAGIVDPTELMSTLGPALERGLAAGPSFALDPIRFRLDDEPFDASIEVSTNTDALPPAGALDLEDPSQLLSIVNSAAELNVSKKLAERLAALAMEMQMASDPNIPPDQAASMAEAQAGLVLVTLVAQGILSDTGDSYRSEVRLANGAVMLNGNPMPFGLQ